VFGTLVSTLLIACMTLIYKYTVGITWDGFDIAVFAILISSTDPVSVISLFNIISVDPTLKILVVGESLLNDAVSICLKQVLDKIKTDNASVGIIFEGIAQFIGIFVGSIVLGVLVGIFIS